MSIHPCLYLLPTHISLPSIIYFSIYFFHLPTTTSLIKQCAAEVDNILKTGSNVFNSQEKMFLSCVTITKNGYLEPAW